MKKKFFTLVEILIVIGIILVLAGFLIPAIQKGITKAEITKCKAQAVTLANAIKQYEAAYGKLPPTFQSSTDYSLVDPDKFDEFIKILQADTSYGNLTKYNPRKIKFLDRQGEKYGEYEDPWEENFFVLLDANYNGKVAPVPGSLHWGCGHHGTLNSPNSTRPDCSHMPFSVIVGSKGPDGAWDISGSNHWKNKDNKDNVYSVDFFWTSEGFELSK